MQTLNMRVNFDWPLLSGCDEEEGDDGLHSRETQEENGRRWQRQEKQKVKDVEQ